MKIPRLFVSENAELNLERILAKKVYYIPKHWTSIEARTVDGDFIISKILDDSKITDEYLLNSRKTDDRVIDLNTFKFNGKDMFITKFGSSMYNLALMNDKLEEILFTQSYPNPSYCVFERKKDSDVLVMNTSSTKHNGTRISCYNYKGKQVASFNATMYEEGYGRDTLTSVTSVVKTKKQNYLVLHYFNNIAIVDEDFNILKQLKVSSTSSKKISVIDMKGTERLVALGMKETDKYPRYTHVVNVFDNNFELVDQLDAEKFGCKLIFICESFKLNGKEYLFFAHENEKRYADLKILNTGFEELFSVKDVDLWNVRVGKFNGQDYIFMPSSLKEKIQIYDENFKLKDSIKISGGALKNKYSIVNLNGVDYFTGIQDNNLSFYSGEFPLTGSFFRKKKPSSIQLKNDPNNMWTYDLMKIIPFNHKDEDFLALEYWHNECTDIYDSNLKFVRSFPGGDFCIA